METKETIREHFELEFEHSDQHIKYTDISSIPYPSKEKLINWLEEKYINIKVVSLGKMKKVITTTTEIEIEYTL